ncbi:17880_t:CDS:2, partial [Funneliformis caledonium]
MAYAKKITAYLGDKPLSPMNINDKKVTFYPMDYKMCFRFLLIETCDSNLLHEGLKSQNVRYKILTDPTNIYSKVKEGYRIIESAPKICDKCIINRANLKLCSKCSKEKLCYDFCNLKCGRWYSPDEWFIFCVDFDQMINCVIILREPDPSIIMDLKRMQEDDKDKYVDIRSNREN